MNVMATNPRLKIEALNLVGVPLIGAGPFASQSAKIKVAQSTLQQPFPERNVLYPPFYPEPLEPLFRLTIAGKRDEVVAVKLFACGCQRPELPQFGFRLVQIEGCLYELFHALVSPHNKVDLVTALPALIIEEIFSKLFP